MISVIVYGRNDQHGYNLHRRAALSLNAIATMLSQPNDEVIFVDYNSANYLPTFPEAIDDTLTAQARARLRVIRVRPDFHQAVVGDRSSLPVIEPIARNIALRRVNPANVWALSTNTDMVFAIEDGRPLAAVIEKLPPGLYHAPRFEVPEILWETLDRRDPQAAIASLARWGRRLAIDEIVRAGQDAVFDGPGDFQLFPITAAHEIGGFEEEMIHGWHVDANFARRLRLHFGAIKRAPETIKCYHSGHTREVTAYHAARSDQNSEREFVIDISNPKSSKATSMEWGAPEWRFEEFRLDRKNSIVKALETAIADTPRLPASRELTPESFGDLAYDADHVLPHLINAVAHESPSTPIGYVGCREDLFDAFVRAWSALGGESLLVAASCDWLRRKEDLPSLISEERWLTEPDIFIIEFGEGACDEPSSRLSEAVRLFDKLIAYERESSARARRIVVVNAINNTFEARVRAAIAPSLSPFSTRVRSGRVERAQPKETPRRPTGAHRRWMGRLGNLATNDPQPSLSRAIRVEDWDRRDWRIAASGDFPHLSLEPWAQTDVLWEAVSICEMTSSATCALYVAFDADDAAAALSNRLDLAVIDAAGFVGADRRCDWPMRFAACGAHAAGKIAIYERSADAAGKFDVAIAPAETSRRLGRANAGSAIRAAAEALKPDGRLIVGALVRYSVISGRAAWPSTLIGADGGFARAMAKAGFDLDGGADFRLTAATLDEIADRKGAPHGRAPLLFERFHAPLARVMFVFKKARPADEGAWERVIRTLMIGF